MVAKANVVLNRRIKGLVSKYGLLTTDKLEEAEEFAAREERALSTVLVEKGYLEAKQLMGAMAVQMNMPPIDLDQVVVDESVLELLPRDRAEYYHCLPITKIGQILTIAVANPFDVLWLDDVRIVTGCDIRPVVALEDHVERAIEKAYNPGEQEMSELFDEMIDPEMEEVEDLSMSDDFDISDLKQDGAPVVKLVNLIIFQAVKSKVSDIHIEPMERRIRVRYRTDGVLHETFSPPKKMQNAISSRIKIMAGLDIAERRKPQDGKFQLKIEGRGVDFRVSILPLTHGEKIVMRILDSSNLALSLVQLGFETRALEHIQETVKSPWGMLLVTGPTGSGKSTTLYSCLNEVMSIQENIVTVEDPVEYALEGVNQCQVNAKAGLTFAGALRSILRQDPDIVMVGEIRDLETVEIAVKAALTGHLVLSTLHTNDAPSTITRMIDMGVDPFMVASSLMLVAAQRLGRVLCDFCKKPHDVKPERLLDVGFTEAEIADHEIFETGGCDRCTEGFKGRFALLETLKMTEALKRVIVDGGSAMDIKSTAMEEGLISLRRCGVLNVLRGKTSIEEIIRVTMRD